MAEYIDREAVLAEAKTLYWDRDIKGNIVPVNFIHPMDVRNIPAADVASVVRCKDCKHYKGLAVCEYLGDCGGTNWYCAWGERMDGEA